MRLDRTEIRLILLTALSLFCVYLAVINFRERAAFALPSDGIVWQESDGKLTVQALVPQGPAEAAGIRVGDRLFAIDGAPANRETAVTQRLFELGAGRRAHYELLRDGNPLQLELTVAPARGPVTVRAILRLVGVMYLLLGVFVLWRRLRAERAMHFALYCLASFVLFTFSYTGSFTALDWTVYWMNAIALLLQPALFAHFCLSYPLPERGTVDGRISFRNQWLFAICGSAALLAAIHAGVAFGFLHFDASLVEVRNWLDRIEIGYLAGMYALGSGLLIAAYRRNASRLLRKQVGWVLGSATAALLPFTAIYGVPYFLGVMPNPWMNLSALSLGLLPMGIAYTIARHRLLEVEIAIGRSAAYALASGALVGTYFGLAALAGNLVRQFLPGGGTVILVLAVIVSGLLFHPLQSWIQAQIDGRFLRHRYDYRETLLRVGRELSIQPQLDRMTGALLEELTGALEIRRAAIFVATDAERGAFRLQSAAGLDDTVDSFRSADLSFLRCFEQSAGATSRQHRLFFSGWGREIDRALGPAVRENPDWRQTITRLGLSYYFPCWIQGRLVAVLALGKTSDGELLSEQDAALVETIAGYLAAAIENVGLVESLAAKARQYEELQQFSENILESINVGLLAVDLNDIVQAVNTPLELMMPLPFRQARGRALREIFPAELMTEFERSRDDASIHNIYRHRTRIENGQEKVLNIAIAPLLSKSCEWIGRLIIVDDVTDRVTLESQLAQAEKLSSVGLLAAGVAHEVNTPLTVISTQAQMLAKQLPAEDKNFKVVEKIIRQTFRASEIVNSLLNFSRTKGASFAPVELNKVISETLLLLDHQLKTGRVVVESHLEPGLPMVHGNSDKLQQVFLNLFLNAKDAMPEGGQLRVTTWAEDSRVRIEIRDTGVGISPENLHRIYDPFFTTKGAGRGTGLGLAVSYGIITEHAGKILAESRPGFGTRFELEFPVLGKAVHA